MKDNENDSFIEIERKKKEVLQFKIIVSYARNYRMSNASTISQIFFRIFNKYDEI